MEESQTTCLRKCATTCSGLKVPFKGRPQRWTPLCPHLLGSVGPSMERSAPAGGRSGNRSDRGLSVVEDRTCFTYASFKLKCSWLGGASGKEPAWWCRLESRGFNPWVRKIPWRRKRQPTLVSLPQKSHGQRLVGYSPWGHNKLDTTEHAHTDCSWFTLLCQF